jgi:polyketide synthase PksN
MNVENKRTALLEKMRTAAAPVNANKDTASEPIAIIGMAGYLPQSENLQAFWEALDEDRSLIEEIPAHRFNMDKLYDAAGKDADKFHTKWAGLLPDIRQFDPAFFGILPSEADLMDPRKRLLLMAAYHALEDAGYAPRSLKATTTGVFIAAEEDEYRQCLLENGVDMKNGSGSSSSLIANQLSYFFDFRGPSEYINTMCSGAAVAIHRAVKALRAGEIDYALVGAANILLHPDPFIYLSRTGQMSPHSSVLSFGKEARGFLRADGVGAIVLKPLSKAIADKDGIYAVIKHSAVNYNGQGGLSMAAPNIPAHTDLIRTCYQEAGIDPRRVGYIEAQGMGNPVADIAEWEAFNKALKSLAKDKGLQLPEGGCRVSTLKPMMGHMHSASALGALFKIIRSFATNKIHCIQGFTTINPDLELEGQPCRLATTTESWPEESWPRLAGIHSHGSGGNNAHLLIEEYKAPAQTTTMEGEPVVIPISATTAEQCKTMVHNLAAVVTANPGYSLASFAFTLQRGRDALPHRVAFVAATRQEWLAQAKAYGERVIRQGIWQGAVTEKKNSMLADDADATALAKAWVEGVAINWNATPFTQPVQRLHLPVYPFNCSSYWMPEASQTPTTLEVPSPAIAVNEQVAEMIRQTLSYFLKIPALQIDIHEEFSAMGFDSLLVTNLSKRLNDQYGLVIEPAVFFGHNTAAKLIAYISKEFAGRSVQPQQASSTTTSTGLTVNKTTQDIPPAPSTDKDLIAVIGLAGSFPQAANLDAFWKNLLAGQDCIEEIPAGRWAVQDHFIPDMEAADKAGKSYGKWGGFLNDLYYFDPLFFNIAPSEAAGMNPKERQFLQCAWHVLEDAGYTPQSLAHEQVGVFAGVTRSGLDPYKVSMFPVANRVSYTMNFRGPSMPVDTACSSSLVAIHEACQHIHAGECTVAIAGGVHAFLGPSHYAALSGLHMLSPDGRSRSFGSEANGMVPGEGVGAVLLKPLQQALADRDHIYGVIRASATNHGGKSNGFTVPNPAAHAQLITHTLQKAQVNARDINYVEAHGTGTSLGDPIEIRGLLDAFRNDTPDAQYCPIGSVKSNIGHLEAAAGISGLAKVLLQMKKGRLVPSLHAQQLNPHINFANTPFYVQQEQSDWLPVDKHGNRIARMACLSSFGAGGSNAHLVVAEGPLVNRPTAVPDKPVLLVLSAREPALLQEQARQLMAFADAKEIQPHLLPDMAYTLQVGRVALDHRLALTAATIPELTNKLAAFLSGQSNGTLYYYGNRNQYKGITLLTAEQEADLPEAINAGHYTTLLEAWVRGYAFDWHSLYAVSNQDGSLPHRISLPGYPFLKEYFGLPDTGQQLAEANTTPSSVLHPLVHRNESTFAEQQFTARFAGDEFFLRDHVVQGEKLLPGVAYLEMVRAAITMATGHQPDNDKNWQVHLQHVAWIRPVAVKETPAELTIQLEAAENGAISFTIYSQDAASATEEIRVHSQGTVCLTEAGEDTPALDIPSIQQLANRQKIMAAQCYTLFDQLGITYGPAHQAIDYIQTGEEAILARLTIPPAIAGTLQQYWLHPSMMDAAFQAIMGYMVAGKAGQDKDPSLAVPFALESLTVYALCTATMWAYIRYHLIDNNKPALINNLSFDLDLCNEDGQVCVRMQGFVSREFQKENRHGLQPVLYLQPAWETAATADNTNTIVYDERVVLYATGLLEAPVAGNGIRYLAYQPVDTGMADQLEQLTLMLFAEVQSLLRAMPAGKVLVQVLLQAGEAASMLTAIAGLLKTARMENPRFAGQVILVEEGTDTQAILIGLQQCSQQPEDTLIHYARGQRKVQRLQTYTPASTEVIIPWKTGGVYLITGGAGGLGLLLAQEITQRAQGVQLILTGRSALAVDKLQQLEQLKQSGARVEYKQVDIAQAGPVDQLIQAIIQEHGALHGVIHAAGIIRDNFLIKKTAAEVKAVLAAKVQGLINLDIATRQVRLDHFIVFSSVAGVMGNTGQGDYAVANAFMDGFVHHRHQLVTRGQRYGTSVSINWPLWKAGGMQVGAAVETMMKDTLGMLPMETNTGLTALYTMLAAGHPQMMVVAGHLPVLRTTFLEQVRKAPTVTQQPVGEQVTGLKEKTITYLKKLLSGVINLSPDRINADTALEEYGIDSIMVMKMTTELEKVFGVLPKTLFFEYQHISELSTYFLSSHAGKLMSLLGTGLQQPASAPKPIEQPAVTPVAFKRKALPVVAGATHKASTHTETDIAIIGVSGSYPQARTLREFWDNLVQGKNCITEIPPARWDHELYFDADKNKAFKTNTKWGGFLEGMDEFDPLFFNISPREAEVTDPQERLFLQCAYATLEDAGYTRQSLWDNAQQGKVGVYVGVMWNEYQQLAAQEMAQGRPMVLSSGSASIANRVSYYCNFNGPSVAVDTMCSSSLTSIHLACQGLRQGDCAVAIAGGVNVSVHPSKYLILGYGKMASSKGLCESFGEGGDGYVPSEGVGAVMLKPLSRALADGDQVYGVIKGSALNHGGKVNGYNVPNPKAHAKVIDQAITAAGWDPRTISYIEAHGTGTALGDPIEIAGLATAFGSNDKQFCAIGSVKSNIGHAESAAGIAGITKVLLQMKHGKLVPSLHSTVLNTAIDFANSPFRVQQELAEWNRPRLALEGKEREYPRRAGISSFGAGGANAHIVIEEYIPASLANATQNNQPSLPVGVLLSARQEDRLQEMVQQLLVHIRNNAYTDKDLPGMAYTLQTGRENMEERLAVEVSTIQELDTKLQAYLNGEKGIENLWQGKANNHQAILSFVVSDEDMGQTLDTWCRKKKFKQLLPLWVNGVDINWKKLYTTGDHSNYYLQRISLPTYPFARDRYWPLPLQGTPTAATGATTTTVLHPLVHQNTSTFAIQQFSSTFTGEEFFLKDHVVNGKKLLPGVAYLEMIYEAMGIAGGRQGQGIEVEHLVWLQPFSVNGHPENIRIDLLPQDNGDIRFDIHSHPDANETNPRTHSQGMARYVDATEVARLDIQALQGSMKQGKLEADACYALFAQMGIVYGAAQQGIQCIYKGQGQVLARLSIPAGVANTLSQYALHPSLLDAALQSVIGCMITPGAPIVRLPLAIPFAIRRIQILQACTPVMWAHIRHQQAPGIDSATPVSGGLTFDIDLCNELGEVCVQIEGFTSRELEKQALVPAVPTTLLLEHYWQEKKINESHHTTSHTSQILVCIEEEELVRLAQEQLPDTRIISLPARQAGAFEQYALAIFGEVKKWLQAKPKHPLLMQVAVSVAREKQVLMGIAGLLKTAALENPLFNGQLIGMEPGTDSSILISRIRENRKQISDTVIRYRQENREVFSVKNYMPALDNVTPIWKSGGVYLITGGAGGLGLIFAAAIAQSTRDATVVLTGRSPLKDEATNTINRLQDTGLRITYRQADMADEKAVNKLVRGIVQEFGQLNGIVHCAGLLRDHYILKQTEEDIKAVLGPKVAGTEYLDRTTKDLPLDLFILCSSTTGVTGNAGQAAYALANAFMDQYAAYRQTLVQTNQRSGKTLSVNWPLWREGGMQVSAEQEKNLFDQYGMIPLETKAGIEALYQAMRMDASQVMVLQGDAVKLKANFLEVVEKESTVTVAPSPSIDKPDQSTALDYFKHILSAAIKLPAIQINANKPMEEYGIDSVMVMQMTNELEKVFGSLSKTLFFEYQSIGELTNYFLETHPGKLHELLAVADAPIAANKGKEVKGTTVQVPAHRFKVTNPVQEKKQDNKSDSQSLDIAIVGLAGSYPQAPDIAAFWQVLKEGRNCITEIPVSRWDHNVYFDTERNQPGKTYSKWGGFLHGVEEFDPLFFHITPKEAATMDPQERLFLQCVYEAMEDAGYTRQTLGINTSTGVKGSVGVFAGVMTEEYQLYGPEETALGRPLVLSGNSASVANRVSWFCNFNGPSITLNTMCSSSLTTIHLACQSLQLGECEAAIAGGVNLSLHPNKYVGLAYGKFLSGKGLCESFGAGGDGYVPGEGVGAVILKPLHRAQTDGDHIYGVIKGTAINHGGKTNGYTVPNPIAQTQVINKALQVAGFDPRSISYLEAHGTGTSLGDPIEIAGLNKAFGNVGKQYCSIGSVKSNIGHAESAAGIAGLTKVLLQMKYRQLVPSLHADPLNPHIDFVNSPFRVQQELAEWQQPEVTIEGKPTQFPRRAGISSFGAGGANAHLLIEEFIPVNIEVVGTEAGFAAPQQEQVILLSAKTTVQLQQQAERLLKWVQGLSDHSGMQLANLAFTLQAGREAMEERWATQVSSFAQLENKLHALIHDEQTTAGVYKATIQAAYENWEQDGSQDVYYSPDQLMELWVKGATINWDQLRRDGNRPVQRPQRISLPVYPFAKKVCWFSKPARTSFNGLLLHKQWVQASPAAADVVCRQVLILHTGQSKGIAQLIQQRVEKAQLLDMDDASLLSQIISRIDWKSIDGYIDLLGMASEPVINEWIPLLQTLIEQGKKESIQVMHISQGLSSFQNSNSNPAGALAAGLYKMLGSEYSHIVSRQVDVEMGTPASLLVEQVVNELYCRDEAASVCYRAGKRYHPVMQEITGTASTQHLSFSKQDIVWITGGTRGLGYLCAQQLVRHYGVKRLVLTGRELLPSRNEWDQYINQNSALAQKLKGLLALEALGVEVKVLATDLANAQEIQEQLDAIKSTGGPIAGLIHCAGIGDQENPAFIKKSIPGIQSVLAPKVQGTYNLYQCFKEEPLQFFLLFSSVSAAIPSLGAGQAAYAMANAWMDHFAETTSAAFPITSIQWPNWKETGMGEIRSKAYTNTGLQALTDEQGLQLLDRILQEKRGPVVMPCLVDKAPWQPGELLQVSRRVKIAAMPPANSPLVTPTIPATMLTAQVQEWLTALFARELNMETSDLKADKPFPDYGIDSILITQLIQPVKKALGADIDPSVLFEYQTIGSFAAWLGETYPGEFEKLLLVTKQAPAPPPPAAITAARSNDIAVVGMACRFPGAPSLDAYWELLQEGRSAIKRIPADRWHTPQSFYAGLLDDLHHFDPGYFMLHENDVKAMDPQALLALEESLALLYHAGYTAASVKGKSIGVYLGGRSRHQPGASALEQTRNPIVTVGQNYLSANISRFYDLRGPAMVIDTACSSALAGMKMAIQALLDHEIEAAMVGGVNVLHTAETHQLFQQRGILNKGKDFHLFDQRAGGIVPGEGIGMVLLKKVEQAQADGDTIYAVVKSVAINNDGRTAGPAAPNIEALKAVMQTALHKSGYTPQDIHYIEVNGSGTELTDLIEMKAIQAVYRNGLSIPCNLGSVKPNIGHPLCAEGIAGFIKVVQMLHSRKLVPFLSGQQSMKYFDFTASPFHFSRAVDQWPAGPAIAALNCFADGGTNAHVIVSAWEETTTANTTTRQPLAVPVLNRRNLQQPVLQESIWELFN